jgi:hypothetical protein
MTDRRVLPFIIYAPYSFPRYSSPSGESLVNHPAPTCPGNERLAPCGAKANYSSHTDSTLPCASCPLVATCRIAEILVALGSCCAGAVVALEGMRYCKFDGSMRIEGDCDGKP